MPQLDLHSLVTTLTPTLALLSPLPATLALELILPRAEAVKAPDSRGATPCLRATPGADAASPGSPGDFASLGSAAASHAEAPADYCFTTDHKKIGRLYVILSFLAALGCFLRPSPALAGGPGERFSASVFLPSRDPSPASLAEGSRDSSPEPFLSRDPSPLDPGAEVEPPHTPSFEELGLRSAELRALVSHYCQRFHGRGLFGEETPGAFADGRWFGLPRFWTPAPSPAPGAGGLSGPGLSPENPFLGQLLPRPLRPAGRLLDLALDRFREALPPFPCGGPVWDPLLGSSSQLSGVHSLYTYIGAGGGILLGLALLALGWRLASPGSTAIPAGAALRGGLALASLGSLTPALGANFRRALHCPPPIQPAPAPAVGVRPGRLLFCSRWLPGRLASDCRRSRFSLPRSGSGGGSFPSLPFPRSCRPSFIPTPQVRAQAMALPEQRALWLYYDSLRRSSGQLELLRRSENFSWSLPSSISLGDLHRAIPSLPTTPEVGPLVANHYRLSLCLNGEPAVVTPALAGTLNSYLAGLVDGDGSFYLDGYGNPSFFLTFVVEDGVTAFLFQRRFPSAIVYLTRTGETGAGGTRRHFQLKVYLHNRAEVLEFIHRTLGGRSWNTVRAGAMDRLLATKPSVTAIEGGTPPRPTLSSELPPLGWFAGMFDADGHGRLVLASAAVPRVSLEVESTKAINLAPFQRVFGGNINEIPPKVSQNRPGSKHRWSSSNQVTLQAYLHYATQVPHLNATKSHRLAVLQAFLTLKQLKAYQAQSPYLVCWLAFLEDYARNTGSGTTQLSHSGLQTLVSAEASRAPSLQRELDRVRRALAENPPGTLDRARAWAEVERRLREVRRIHSQPFILRENYPFAPAEHRGRRGGDAGGKEPC